MKRMVLYMYVENMDLRDKYQEAILKHNNKASEDFPDAGFDLFVPNEMILNTKLVGIDYGIKCEAYIEDDNVDDRISTGYYLYPRSSIYKTPLRMCNSVGIIDSGYRGNIKANFDVLCNDKIEKFNRINQICAPELIPIHVILLDNINELSNTSRGIGGFGSTGY
jgi:dUTP pyrophosphatase